MCARDLKKATCVRLLKKNHPVIHGLLATNLDGAILKALNIGRGSWGRAKKLSATASRKVTALCRSWVERRVGLALLAISLSYAFHLWECISGAFCLLENYVNTVITLLP